MTVLTIAPAAVNVVSGIFAIAGIVNLSGSAHVRAAYRLWRYPPHFYRVIGVMELMTALFLMLPQTRIWGVAASGFVIFGSIVTLLNHRQYLWSLPAMLLLVALVPASLAPS
jgi:hypothetical protein